MHSWLHQSVNGSTDKAHEKSLCFVARTSALPVTVTVLLGGEVETAAEVRAIAERSSPMNQEFITEIWAIHEVTYRRTSAHSS